ncbi:hypothetical protein vseg_004608 [Gypsophila vaccaria]
MLCSSSSTTKMIRSTHRRCTSSSSTSSSTTVTEDPSSPKVGCMGQVKRNNKVVNLPSIISFTSSTTSNNSNSNSNSSNNGSSTRHHVIKCHEPNNYTSNSIIKYHKLKRFFSTKSPTSVIPATRTNTSGSQKGKIGRKNVGNNIVCGSKVGENKINSCRVNKNENEKGSLVNLIDMDPPLPVTKKIGKNNEGENVSTLWKRRSGGAPLESLRVQVIQQNLSLLVPANNTV